MQKAFTLIELSIVLVIIGLIVGGILVGRDLITASTIRAQIAQIERYHSAVNTFRGKYNNSFPGDINNADAIQFGFDARGALGGQGDGDGNIQGFGSSFNVNGLFQAGGEAVMFWKDLSAVKLIDGGFTKAKADLLAPSTIQSTQVRFYLPEAKMGRANFVYLQVLQLYTGAPLWGNTGTNYFVIAKVPIIRIGASGIDGDATAGLSVSEAYAMDKKLDDGLPQSGNVLATYAGWWADPTATHITAANVAGYTTALAGSTTTCYDNNNVGGALQQYSITQGNGSYVNCALSFKFQ